ncbi:alpha/beta hydrolase [Pseudomonas putida]|uniref:Alpha/beta hydrolase n=2 Tax=Pseudomonas putida TaxID=303 RepID=A0A6I6XMV6_PSEPU|nr:alpha/beta hydrolase [Pseudomonas putida]
MVDDYGSELQMDIYEPGEAAERSPSGVPIMVYVHGGGWVSGTPAETAATLRWFSEQGYLVLSPEYTLATADRATWDIAMPQVTCALAWVGQQAGELGGDPSRIAVLGGSAGANLALTATYAAADTQQALPCKGDVPKISAVVGLVPAVDPESVFNNTDPVMKGYDQQLVRAYLGGEPADHPNRVKAVQVGTYLSPLAPPTLIVGHKNDHIVPIAGIRDFVDRARDAGIDVAYKEVIWADHTTPLLNYNPVSQALRLQVLDFIRARGL